MKKISDRKRIVIKVGTSTLTHRTGMLNIRRVEQLVKTLADIQNSGHEVILVSSGAIGLGMGKLGLRERPKDTPGKQACAAVGQCELMYLYDNLFAEYSISVAQMLLTKYVLLEKGRSAGIAQGKTSAQIDIILNMYNNNFTIEQIALATQYDVDKIKEIIQKN